MASPVPERRANGLRPKPIARLRSAFLDADCGEVLEMLLEGGEKFVLIDLRDAAAYRSGHVPTAHRVDAAELNDFVGAFPPRTNFILYCGEQPYGAAERAAEFLAGLGRPAHMMRGGAERWSELGFALALGDNPGRIQAGL